MEYLLDHGQSVAAAQVLGAGMTADQLEQEIEALRAELYLLQFGGDSIGFDIEDLQRRAYLLATLVSGQNIEYGAQIRGKALSVAAVIFEHIAHFAEEGPERLVYSLNAILFYSRGEQEAQSATLARKILRGNGFIGFAADVNIQESWRLLFQFLGREFKSLLSWRQNSSAVFFARLNETTEDGPFWVELLSGCLATAKYLVWGGSLSHRQNFANAYELARSWGNARLTWLGLTVAEVSETMVSHSLRAKLSEMGLPGWASEALTMDGFVEMWLPHRAAFGSEGRLANGILSEGVKASLINMPTSSGKSLVAEIAILDQLMKDNASKAIWVVPSRALVYEVSSRINNHLRRIGISSTSLPGGIENDRDDSDQLASARVFVLTPEKLDGLLRRNPKLLDVVRVVVVDETHKIGEAGRGWLLETVIAWLLVSAEQNENLRLLFMSAVLPNRPDFEVWLGEGRENFVSRWATWRPTRLALFTTSGQYNSGWQTSLIQKHSQQVVSVHSNVRNPRAFEVPLLLMRNLREQNIGPQTILVFYYTKDDVNNFINMLAQTTPEPTEVPLEWEALSRKFAVVYGSEHQFTKALRRGVGVDHGDIPIWLRQLVEHSFRTGNLPTLVANQTVLEGVNFPIENIIIGSLGNRVGTHEFRYRLRALDYANLVGRVGRAMVDTEGRCFLVWNWFYTQAAASNINWEVYSAPSLTMESITSQLAVDETELVQAIQRLAASLDGIDDTFFDEVSPWRDRLERLHSSSLAILEQTGAVDYVQLNRWIRRTLAWQQLKVPGRNSLDHYVQTAWRGYQSANRTLYRLASLSGLSVRSAEEVQNLVRQIISSWVIGTEPSFENVFNTDQFNIVVNLRECWRRRPVTYGTRSYLPRIDHFAATAAWIRGEEWNNVSCVICANHTNLQPNTKAGLVAAYVSQMFEFRLPWVLGAVAITARELGGQEDLCRFLEALPARVRYGVNLDEAVTISKICGTERSIALGLAERYLSQQTDQGQLRTWLQHLSFTEVHQWFPDEPDTFINDLVWRLQSLRKRDWTVRRDGRAVVELAGWRNYSWPRIVEVLRTQSEISLILRRDPGNEFDHFAVAVDVLIEGQSIHIGYIPVSHSEEIAELMEWGRDFIIRMVTPPLTEPPQIMLELLDVG